MTQPVFESPPPPPKITDCYFYHSITLSDAISIEGDWDLRPIAAKYLSNYNFKGKRALDIGTATGFLSLYMEAEGAYEVVSFDQSENYPADIIPGWLENVEGYRRMKNGYWFVHSAIGSANKVAYGDIYNIPEAIGPFHIAVLGSILLHLQNPFGALKSAARLAKTLIVVDAYRPYIQSEHMVFRPSMQDGNDYLYWWYIPYQTTIKMLRSLGYSTSEPTMLTATGKAGTVDLYSIVAERA